VNLLFLNKLLSYYSLKRSDGDLLSVHGTDESLWSFRQLLSILVFTSVLSGLPYLGLKGLLAFIFGREQMMM
jgi:hypothetical protein